jgi:hypothetical protein
VPQPLPRKGLKRCNDLGSKAIKQSTRLLEETKNGELGEISREKKDIENNLCFELQKEKSKESSLPERKSCKTD